MYKEFLRKKKRRLFQNNQHFKIIGHLRTLFFITARMKKKFADQIVIEME